MPRFQSSLVDSQCPSRLHKAHTPHHTTPHILTHSVLLSDPLNDRSKDGAPRGTLNGSWGSWLSSCGLLSRTLSALGTNWLWYRVSSMCWARLPYGFFCDGGGRKAKQTSRQKGSIAKERGATYTVHCTSLHTVSHSSMVCSHCIAQTYACLLRSSFSGLYSVALRSRAAVLPCSH